MPDWLSHILIGLIAAELLNLDKKSLIVLGSLLPDFVVKIYLLSFFFPVNDTLLFVSALYHSPIMGFIIPGLLVPFFKYDWRKTYMFITLGFMLHLLADSFTGGYGNGILLYPFSHGFFSFNLFWANQYWIILIGSLVAYIVVRFIKYKILLNKSKI